jgi:hypothetical protein
MSTINKLSRKAVAVGAALALGVTGLFALPASANTSAVSLELVSGTSYTVTDNDVLKLRSDLKQITVSSTGSSTTGQFLKWKVTAADNAANFDLNNIAPRYAISGTTTQADGSTTVTVTANDHRFETGDTVSRVTATGTVNAPIGTVIKTGANTFTYTATVHNDGDGAQSIPLTGSATFTLSVADHVESVTADGFVINSRQNLADTFYQIWLTSAASTTETASVVSWVDTNVSTGITGQGLNFIDPSTEFSSAVREVTFFDREDLVATLNFVQPIYGDAGLKASLTTVPELNGTQVAAANSPRVAFTRQGSADRIFGFDSVDGYSGNVGSVWDQTAKTWTSHLTLHVTDLTPDWTNSPGNIAIGGTYTAQAYGTGSNTTSGGLNVLSSGAVSISGLTTLTVGALVANDTKATVAGTANTTPAESTSDSAVDSLVRLGTASVPVTVDVISTVAGVNVGAGVPVAVTWSNTGYKVNDATTGVRVLTDAAGKITFTVSKTAPTVASGSAVDFTFTPQNLAGGQRATIGLNWVAAAYSLHDLNRTAATVDVDRSINKGGSVSFLIAALDQWKVNAPSTGYRLQVENSGRTSSPQSATYTSLPASFTVSDNSTGLGSTITTVISLEKTTAPTSTNVDNSRATVTTTVLDQTDEVTVTSTPGTDGTAKLPTKTVVAEDARTQQTAVTSYVAADSGDAVATVSGVVRQVITQVARPNATVTVSGDAGFLFRNGQKAAKGSLTFQANGSGAYTVDIISNKAVKESVVTISSGGASVTTKVTFLPALASTGADVVWSQPKSVRAGTTLISTATLVDAWGNPVEVNTAAATTHKLAIAYSGPGFVANQPLVTNAAGQAQIRVFLDERDWAPTAVSFYYVSGTGDAAVATNTVVSESRATWVGPIANAKAGAKKGRVVVEAYRAVGKTVKVFVGRTQVASFVADKANDSMVVRGIKSGTRNVRVVLSGPGEDFRGAITVK